MPRSYASLLRFQGAWSSLQRHSHTRNNTYRKPTRQTSRLGISGIKPARKCAQIIFRSHQTAEVGLGARDPLTAEYGRTREESQVAGDFVLVVVEEFEISFPQLEQRQVGGRAHVECAAVVE